MKSGVYVSSTVSSKWFSSYFATTSPHGRASLVVIRTPVNRKRFSALTGLRVWLLLSRLSRFSAHTRRVFGFSRCLCRSWAPAMKTTDDPQVCFSTAGATTLRPNNTMVHSFLHTAPHPQPRNSKPQNPSQSLIMGREIRGWGAEITRIGPGG